MKWAVLGSTAVVVVLLYAYADTITPPPPGCQEGYVAHMENVRPQDNWRGWRWVCRLGHLP